MHGVVRNYHSTGQGFLEILNVRVALFRRHQPEVVGYAEFPHIKWTRGGEQRRACCRLLARLYSLSDIWEKFVMKGVVISQGAVNVLTDM
jgi:hypothetical protein